MTKTAREPLPGVGDATGRAGQAELKRQLRTATTDLGFAPTRPTPVAREPNKPLHIQIPASLSLELNVKAAQDGVSKRYLVCKALQAAGFSIAEHDLQEDGRRGPG